MVQTNLLFFKFFIEFYASRKLGRGHACLRILLCRFHYYSAILFTSHMCTAFFICIPYFAPKPVRINVCITKVSRAHRCWLLKCAPITSQMFPSLLRVHDSCQHVICCVFSVLIMCKWHQSSFWGYSILCLLGTPISQDYVGVNIWFQ